MKWLFKTDPDTYSWNDLAKKTSEVWDGVANNLALKHLRSVKKGDLIFIYHTGDEKAVVGIAKAVSDAYPDPKQKDSKSAVVEVAPLKSTPSVSLSRIKSNPKLKDWELVKFPRLSVMPVSEGQWAEVLLLGK